MMNITVTDNYRDDGNSINGSGFCYDWGDSLNINITNSIFYNNNSGPEINASYPVNVRYSDIRGGYTGLGNMDANPNFISSGDFHLNYNSPCINAGKLSGAPLFDLDNIPRPLPLNTNPDMGCYEETLTLGETIENKHGGLFQNYPNPFTDKTTLTYYLYEPMNVLFQIINMNGQVIAIYDNVKKDLGYQSLLINTSEYAPGIYLCRMITDNEIQTIKLIKE